MEVIELENGKHTLIVRIPKSWNSPHMIDFRGKTKFYTRNSAGKHQMDIDELRMSFSLSESIIEKIKSFIEVISSEISKCARKDDLEILRKQAKMFQPLDFARRHKEE